MIPKIDFEIFKRVITEAHTDGQKQIKNRLLYSINVLSII